MRTIIVQIGKNIGIQKFAGKVGKNIFYKEMLAIYGFHSEFFLGKDLHQKLQFRTILLLNPYKKCFTQKNSLFNIYPLTVLLSIPIYKLSSLAIRADEAHHRIVNHTLGSMKPADQNPFRPGA